MATTVHSHRDAVMPLDHDRGSDHRGAFSIAEWCRYRGICPATFYNHLQRGEMPATLKIGRRTIITAEADTEWRLRLERQAAAEPAEMTTGRRSRAAASSLSQAGFPTDAPLKPSA